MATKLEGVRTRFPTTCTKDASKIGTLADRYTSYDAIPLLKRFSAQQCGAAGYWYVDADLSARLRDEYDQVSGAVVQVIDNVRQGAEDFVSGAGKWLLFAGAAYLAVVFFSRRRR